MIKEKCTGRLTFVNHVHYLLFTIGNDWRKKNDPTVETIPMPKMLQYSYQMHGIEADVSIMWPYERLLFEDDCPGVD